MKSLFGKLGMLALLATAAGTIVAGCSSSQVPGAGHQAVGDGTTGDVGLKLVPVTGVTLNTVHYVVNKGTTVISEGDLPTPGNAKDFSLGLTLPVGTGYTISLSASAADLSLNVSCGGSYGPFNVLANAATNVSLTLTCHDNTNGSVYGGINVTTDACPQIVFDYVVATPSATDIGKPINVATLAHDKNGKALTYSWKIAAPPVGTFAPATGASSVLTCNLAGANQVVTVTAANGECTKTLTTTVSCNSLLCGNGVVDPGEQCDTAIAGTLCPADCTYVCGDGVAEPPVEQCDPGNTATCDAACHIRTPKCGDGFITSPEVCDGLNVPAGTPSTQTCNSTCDGFITAVCGDGIVNGTEQCDDKGPSPKCSNTCKLVSTDACVTCENNGLCAESVNNCLGVASPFNAAQLTQCYDVLSCIEKSNCLDGTGSLGACYCGTLDTGPCGAAPFTGAGSPNGPCVNEIKAGFPTYTTNQQVLGGLIATDFPSGAAMQRLSCQKTADGSACLTKCGLNTGGPVFP